MSLNNTNMKENVFVSGTCKGEVCTLCGKDAANKIGEEIPCDDPFVNRHNFTAYVCREHFVSLFKIVK